MSHDVPPDQVLMAVAEMSFSSPNNRRYSTEALKMCVSMHTSTTHMHLALTLRLSHTSVLSRGSQLPSREYCSGNAFAACYRRVFMLWERGLHIGGKKKAAGGVCSSLIFHGPSHPSCRSSGGQKAGQQQPAHRHNSSRQLQQTPTAPAEKNTDI